MNNKFILLGVSFLAVSVSTKAFGWGQYGHEQINNAAIDILAEDGGEDAKAAADCFKANKDVVTRLAITPDMDWKMIGNNKDLPADEKHKKAIADKHEHPLHFFEADAFANPPPASEITNLPSGEYKDVFPEYTALLTKNAAKVAEIDPSKAMKDPAHPKPAEVTGHGTAPWRAQQLYRLGVEALKKKDFASAVMYLGAMGHYVGDMSQPFHASLNFNGQHYTPPAAGIHAVFEEGILEAAAKKTKANRNTPLGIWSDFSATDGDVKGHGAEIFKGKSAVSDKEIVPQIFSLVAGSQSYIDPLLKAFSDQCAAANSGKLAGDFNKACDTLEGVAKTKCEDSQSGPATVQGADPSKRTRAKKPTSATAGSHTQEFCVIADPTAAHAEAKVNAAILHGFSSSTVAIDGAQMTVLEAAKRRLGDAAGLLARIWASAYADAGKPAGCGAVQFNDLHVIDNYPMPTYLPGSH
jgi:hypothetical protein